MAAGSSLGLVLSGQPLLAMPAWELLPPPPLLPPLPPPETQPAAKPVRMAAAKPISQKPPCSSKGKSPCTVTNQAPPRQAQSAPPVLARGGLRWEPVEPKTKSTTPQPLLTVHASAEDLIASHGAPALNPSTGFPTLALQTSSGTGLIWELAPSPGSDSRLLALATTTTSFDNAAPDPTSASDVPVAPITVEPPAPRHTASGLSWGVIEPRARLLARALTPPTSSNPQFFQPTVARGPVWELLKPGEEFKTSDLAQEIEASEEAQAKAAEQADALAQETLNNPPSPLILGIGGGARIGFGEPNYGMAYGRLGFMLHEDLAVSIRPAYIFGNSDELGEANNQSSFEMPITLDFWPNFWISPSIGAGFASNTDSDGKVRAMYSGGIDIRIAKNLSLTLGLNYILDSKDADNRDAEAISALYFRF